MAQLVDGGDLGALVGRHHGVGVEGALGDEGGGILVIERIASLAVLKLGCKTLNVALGLLEGALDGLDGAAQGKIKVVVHSTLDVLGELDAGVGRHGGKGGDDDQTPDGEDGSDGNGAPMLLFRGCTSIGALESFDRGDHFGSWIQKWRRYCNLLAG